MSNLCQLLESFSWMLDEKAHIQELAGISGEDYINMYRLYLGDRMDASILPDSPSSELPQAPKRNFFERNTYLFLQEKLGVHQVCWQSKGFVWQVI